MLERLLEKKPRLFSHINEGFPLLNKILKHKVFKNFSYLTIGNSIAQAISLFTVLKITHILVPDDYGLFSFLKSQGLLLLLIADLGIKKIVVRSIAREPERAKDLILNGIILKSGMILIIIILYLIYNNLFGSLTLGQLALVFAFTFVNCIYDLFENAFFGREKMLIPAIINLGYSLLWFLIVYSLPSKLFNVTFLFGSFLFLNILKAASATIFIKTQNILIGQKNNFWKSSHNLFKESWPYFLKVLILLPFTWLSVNFLDLNSTFEQVGFFNLGQKLTAPVVLIIDFSLVSIFPNLSALWVKDKIKFYHYIKLGFKYFMLTLLLLCFFFDLFAKDIIQLLFPASYIGAVKVSQLQVWYLFLAAIDSLTGTIFGAINKEKLILKYAVIKALFCTPIMYIGSYYGALGLAYGFVISVAIFQIYLWFLFLKTLKIRIKYSAILWGGALVSFLLSYFVLSELPILCKVIITLMVLLGGGIFVIKKFKKPVIE